MLIDSLRQPLLTLKNNRNNKTQESNWYSRKYVFNTKECSNRKAEEHKDISHIYKTNSKVTDVNPNLSAITIMISELNIPPKRHRLAEYKKTLYDLFILVYKKHVLDLKTQIG